MEGNYKHRVVDALLERKLLGKGAVLVEGAKWCGKTTTSSRLAKSTCESSSALQLPCGAGVIITNKED